MKVLYNHSLHGELLFYIIFRFLFTQFFCHSIKFSAIFSSLREDIIFTVFSSHVMFLLFSNITCHNFGSCRSPATILNKTNGTILIITFCQMLNECTS